MARLYEFQGKETLRRAGIPTPAGEPARKPEEARAVAERLGRPVVVKAQVFVTGRAAAGGIRFADTPAEAADAAATMLGADIKGQRCQVVLVEERLAVAREMFASVIVDADRRLPLLLFAARGGSGVEELAREQADAVSRHYINLERGLMVYEARDICRRAGLKGNDLVAVADVLVKLAALAKKNEARAAEINPLVVTAGGEVVAADCRITIDDYAVFRHPDLGVEVAREFHRPPTPLDIIAYNVEKNDYRGTFYFVQLAEGFTRADGYIGFHGAGGGGSMMSMDAAQAEGFRIANFCDTSGNPPASKVYRAARIILAQRNLCGYFGSGSGVASQEQFHSARGLVKAFREVWLNIPCVVRLGGNYEERAIEILTEYTRDLPAPVECYGKDTPARRCAGRLRELVDAYDYVPRTRPAERALKPSYSFPTVTSGTVAFDFGRCDVCESKVCVTTCVPQILKLENGRPVLNISGEEAARGKCSECLACEVECFAKGKGGGRVTLPIPGLDEYLAARE